MSLQLLLLLHTLLGVSVFLQFISISSCQSSTTSGDCTTPTGQRGFCINFKQCPLVIAILNNISLPIPQSTRESLAALGCGYEGRDPKVCCVDPSEVPPAVEGHPNIKLLPTNCGIVYEVRVVGGNKPKIFDFPWMAHLLFNKTDDTQEFMCGGTVLNERYILTSGHCLRNPRFVLATVRVGQHDASQQSDCNDEKMKACEPPYQDIAIEETTPHPRFSGRIRENYHHDIGLIRLASPIDFSQMNVVPICIPHLKTYREKPLNNTELWISGWGVTEEGEPSQYVVSEKIPYVPNEECNQVYTAQKRDVIFSQLCAGGLDGGDACGGDGGGPLQAVEHFDGKQRYVQYGIISYGPTQCGRPGFPSVYTRVPHYVKWILDNIKP